MADFQKFGYKQWTKYSTANNWTSWIDRVFPSLQKWFTDLPLNSVLGKSDAGPKFLKNLWLVSNFSAFNYKIEIQNGYMKIDLNRHFFSWVSNTLHLTIVF